MKRYHALIEVPSYEEVLGLYWKHLLSQGILECQITQPSSFMSYHTNRRWYLRTGSKTIIVYDFRTKKFFNRR